ncbi:MAG: polysaccharide deacetylase [Hyphomicrobiales bacterium]|nr:MAG: polysaccharide deacetylase [Hyphomicrobiales bacterium]
MSKFSKQEFLQKLVLNSVYFSGAHLLCQRWSRGLGSIMMLHHVVEENRAPFSPNSHLSVTPKFLDEMLTSLAAENLDFISMDEVAKWTGQAGANSSDRPFIAVTLDDGYRDNLENAVPIFRKHNMPYTIYVAPGFVDGKADLWWEDLEHIIAARDTIFLDLDGGREEIDTSTSDLKYQAFAELMEYLTSAVDETRQREIVKDLAKQYRIDVNAHRRQQIMTWSEIAELNKDPLCTIGVHTINHPMLARLSEKDAKFEMMESASIIEAELGERPKHIAYPYGMPKAAGIREFKLAKACGFTTAVTTRHGVVHREHNEHPTALPRISLNGSFQSQRYVKTLISGIPALLQNKGKRINVR